MSLRFLQRGLNYIGSLLTFILGQNRVEKTKFTSFYSRFRANISTFEIKRSFPLEMTPSFRKLHAPLKNKSQINKKGHKNLLVHCSSKYKYNLKVTRFNFWNLPIYIAQPQVCRGFLYWYWLYIKDKLKVAFLHRLLLHINLTRARLGCWEKNSKWPITFLISWSWDSIIGLCALLSSNLANFHSLPHKDDEKKMKSSWKKIYAPLLS